MYTNMITNYTVFKSLLESDPRKMSGAGGEEYEPVRPSSSGKSRRDCRGPEYSGCGDPTGILSRKFTQAGAEGGG